MLKLEINQQLNNATLQTLNMYLKLSTYITKKVHEISLPMPSTRCTTCTLPPRLVLHAFNEILHIINSIKT